MPTVLNLGVTDIPYAWGQRASGGISASQAMRAARRVARGQGPPPNAGGGVTTGDVANRLELRYHLFQTFVTIYQARIVGHIDASFMAALDTARIRRGRGADHALAAAGSDIEDTFRTALSARAFDGRIAGVPTRAAMRGVSHRFRNPYAPRGPRPSFIDTGLFQASMRAWFVEVP